jgi:hypothetical protein
MSKVIHVDLVLFTHGLHYGQYAVLAECRCHCQLLTFQGGVIMKWNAAYLEEGDRRDLWLRSNTRDFVDIPPQYEPAVMAIVERLKAAGGKVRVGANQPKERLKLIDALAYGRLESMSLSDDFPDWGSVYFKAEGCDKKLRIRFTEGQARSLMEMLLRIRFTERQTRSLMEMLQPSAWLEEEFIRDMREANRDVLRQPATDAPAVAPPPGGAPAAEPSPEDA